MKKQLMGVTSITFGELHKIVHIEMDERVNLHDVLQVVKQWNLGEWKHPNNGDMSDIAGGDAKIDTFSFQ